MRIRILLLLIYYVASASLVHAQTFEDWMKEGNKNYLKKKYEDAEISFRKSAEANPGNPEIIYNLGDALYKQEKFDEAATEFSKIPPMTDDPNLRAKAFHNLGNCMLQQKKYEQSIEAFKNALKENPADKDTKYNLAYAQSMLQQQQQQKQQQKQNQQEDEKQKQQQQQQSQGEKQQQQQHVSKQEAEKMLNALAQKEKEAQKKVNKQQGEATIVITKPW